MSNTTSFELSKQLHEVAKNKEVELPLSTYYFVPEFSMESFSEYYKCNRDCLHHLTKNEIFTIATYTTDELLAWLPGWCIVYKPDTEYIAYSLSNGPLFDADTPSKALCKLAIYLLENDLLK